ncbi:cytochrome P450 [Ramaria rubella]|nr:cytochrome P450 [Ramaria rubella]
MFIGLQYWSLLLSLFTMACLLFLYIWTKERKSSEVPSSVKGLRLPPGPPGLPVIGNFFDIPKEREWEAPTRWARKYGDLVSIKIMGEPVVFINSLEAAHDLFDKRGAMYSDRADFNMADLVGWRFALNLMRYGTTWRRHRRAFHQHFYPAAAARYQDIQVRQTREFLWKLRATPDEFLKVIQELTTSTIMEVVYGLKVQSSNDRYYKVVDKALEGLAKVTTSPGVYMIDHLPFLKYMPEWIPGAGFKKTAKKWGELTKAMYMEPFAEVKKAMSAGTAESCVVTTLLEGLPDQRVIQDDDEDVVRNSAGIAFAAAVSTVAAVVSGFFLAMVLYPETQKKAQEELDRVIGADRLPEFQDSKNLPYVMALCAELQRWRPVLPLAFAHRVMEDDFYRGYFIPKDSLVVGNAWQILHDEKVYGPRPEEFEPERFFQPGISIPTMQYGFGRRICPGRYMADNSVFIAVASILHVFHISHATDNNGKEIPVKPAYKSGIVIAPEPFKCSIKPRSPTADKIISGLGE